ncbi:MAG: nucleotidyltransferase domain-containing protein [Lachnospiraceae bacterium]|nr:nucleotidyltransferase domain-containing protein [Lachnospiraceae bacterium]
MLQIILYGSVARKEDTLESDIDIAVIVKEVLTVENRKRLLSLAADLDLRYERVFSIIDIEQKSLDKWGEVLPFYKNVQKEGIVLWKTA